MEVEELDALSVRMKSSMSFQVMEVQWDAGVCQSPVQCSSHAVPIYGSVSCQGQPEVFFKGLPQCTLGVPLLLPLCPRCWLFPAVFLRRLL